VTVPTNALPVRSFHDHGGKRQSVRKLLGDRELRAQVMKRAASHGYGPRSAVRLLFDDPAALHSRFVELLARYWADAFAMEWARIEPNLAEGVEAAGREIASGGAFRFLQRLAPRLRVDLDDHSFGIDVPHDHRIKLDAGNQLLLVPSVYTWPHVRVNCDAPWQLTLVYRAPQLAESLRPPKPPELVNAFRALGDPTRLRIVQLIARRPRSTQELAALVGLSAPGTSKHLRTLSAAGLVTTRREGYYVVYSLAAERMQSLGGDLARLIAR
jgi:DNA-binding transcriptional ArsR family regulator